MTKFHLEPLKQQTQTGGEGEQQTQNGCQQQRLKRVPTKVMSRQMKSRAHEGMGW
jgi:hypothetical protein